MSVCVRVCVCVCVHLHVFEFVSTVCDDFITELAHTMMYNIVSFIKIHIYILAFVHLDIS